MLPIEEFMLKNNLRQVDLVTYLGVTKGHISQVCNGKIDLSDNLLRRLIENDRGWDVTPLKQVKPAGIPLIPVDAIAGIGSVSYRDLQVEDYYTVGIFRDVDFLIRVSGDSMSPKYCGGDLVACRLVRESSFFQWGRIYVLDTKSQGILIKRIQKSEIANRITCVSENTRYDEFDVDISDITHIALVIGAITLE